LSGGSALALAFGPHKVLFSVSETLAPLLYSQDIATGEW